MDADNPDLGPALLRWVNTFESQTKVESWRDLQDGRILWTIVKTIQPEYFEGELPDTSPSDNWVPRWQNLKHVFRHVITFIREECEKLPELSKKMNPDLKAMALDASPVDSIQLLKAVLLAAMYSPLSNERMVKVMEQLGPRVAIPIATCIGQMESLDLQLAESENQNDVSMDMEGVLTPDAALGSPTRGFDRDPELEREEQLIKAYTTIKKLEERNVDLAADLEETQTKLNSMKDELTEAKYQMENGGLKGASGDMVERLKQKVNQDKDTIAELENELVTSRAMLETQEKQLERLKSESESRQQYRDELQLMKVERDDLLQKSKASENLKKKIQTLQEAEKSNQTLRQDLDKANDDLRSLQSFKDRCAILQKANEENMKTIQNGEQEIFDQKTTRKRLDHELKLLLQRLETAKDRTHRDHEMIAEQEERIRDLEAIQGKSRNDSGNLDDELSSNDKVHNDLKTKVTQLESENALLKQDHGISEDKLLSQQAHQMLQSRYEKLEKKYLDVYQENLGLESALQDAQQDTLESRPFVELRDRLKSESEKCIAAEKRVFDLESELSDAKVNLEASEAKLSSVGKDKSEALSSMETSSLAETALLKTENDRLLQHIKTIESELEGQRSLLRHALLDKSALLKEEAELRASNELKLVEEHLKLVQEEPTKGDDIAMKLTQRLEDARRGFLEIEANALKERERHSTEVEELKARLARAEETAAEGVKTPLQTNLERELALMSSAWYDITSRMQSDAVVVQRRGDAPRSFLNRQRRLLNNPSIPKR